MCPKRQSVRWQGASSGGRFDLPSSLASSSTSARSLSGRPSARAPASARATPSARPAVASPMSSSRCGEAMRRRRKARRACALRFVRGAARARAAA
eukprot:5525043-Prymnesium_polylepis.1